jgi:hypothetical protein
MPKAKPTQVIVHRIELQEKEREMLETLVAGKTVKNLVEPAVAVAGAYVAYKSAYALYNWGDDVYDTVKKNMATAKRMRDEKITTDSFENPLKNDGFANDGSPTNIFGLPGWGIWPGVL